MAAVLALAWPRLPTTDLTNRAITSYEFFGSYPRHTPWRPAHDGSADQEVSTP